MKQLETKWTVILQNCIDSDDFIMIVLLEVFDFYRFF